MKHWSILWILLLAVVGRADQVVRDDQYVTILTSKTDVTMRVFVRCKYWFGSEGETRYGYADIVGGGFTRSVQGYSDAEGSVVVPLGTLVTVTWGMVVPRYQQVAQLGQIAIGADGNPVLPPAPRDFKEHVNNDGPFPEWYQFFGRDAQGNLTPIGSPIKVPPYSGMDLSFNSDDMAGDIVLGKLNDVAEGQQGQSVNWISSQNQQGQAGTTPTPNPASPVPSGGTPQTANGTPATGTSTGGRGNPLTFGQTGGAATAVDKGVAETVYGVGTVANGLLEAIRQNTEKSAKALTDTPPATEAPAMAEPENKGKWDAVQVQGLPSKILPKMPEVTMPGEQTQFTVPIQVPHIGTFTATVDLSKYSTPINLFKLIVRGALALWFFFMSVKAVKEAFA